MTSSKPYLLRALYEWILDNDFTPHIIADADAAEVEVPPQAIQEGRVVLNISPTATGNLLLENDAVSFKARFGGVSRDIWLPMHAILAIYARENGQGMMFAGGDEDDDPTPPDSDSGPDGQGPDGPKSDGPKLRLIK
ncbi:MAG: ClpXP protease specificity-enhancing factor [Xanthomonadales bacterium]|jgi:stringent starvation protein B|nr:ClpXP protease specificity-enhancing factor [Xanthomonadales bacterium]